jgi:hypothetical protein
MLPALGALSVAERVVVDGNVITGGGVTAGIDFALTVAAEAFGEDIAKSIQLGMEYDPHPRSTPARLIVPALTSSPRRAQAPQGDRPNGKARSMRRPLLCGRRDRQRAINRLRNGPARHDHAREPKTRSAPYHIGAAGLPLPLGRR